MATKVIDLASYRDSGRRERPLVMPAPQRMEIEENGSRLQRRELKRLEQKEKFRYGDTEEKTMQISLKALNHPLFISALHKLDNSNKYPSAAVAWNVMRLSKAAHEAIKQNRAHYQEETKKLAELDEHGEVKVSPDGRIVFKSPEDEATHNGLYEKFMQQSVELKGRLLRFDDIAQVGLAPSELEALEDLIDPTTVPQD